MFNFFHRCRTPWFPSIRARCNGTWTCKCGEEWHILCSGGLDDEHFWRRTKVQLPKRATKPSTWRKE